MSVAVILVFAARLLLQTALAKRSAVNGHLDTRALDPQIADKYSAATERLHSRKLLAASGKKMAH